MRMVGVGSRKVPIARRNRFMSKNTTRGLFVLLRRYAEKVSGTLSRVMTQLKAKDVKIRNITSPVIRLVWIADSRIPLRSSSR